MRARRSAAKAAWAALCSPFGEKVSPNIPLRMDKEVPAPQTAFTSVTVQCPASTGQTDGRPLNIREMMNRIRKSTNSTWAIQAEVPAIPVKPKNPAIMAMIRKTTA
jgi:hypothetical protein